MTDQASICSRLNFDASAVFPQHASLAGLIAGFSLAGLLLVLEQPGGLRAPDLSPETESRLRLSALLFAWASICGLLAAYLFSASAGDHCLLSAVELPYPSVLMSISGILMAAAISQVLRSSDLPAAIGRQLHGFIAVLSGAILVRLAFDIQYSAGIERGLAAAGLTKLNEVDVDERHSAGVARLLLRSSPRPIVTLSLAITVVLWVSVVAALYLARHRAQRLRRDSHRATYSSHMREMGISLTVMVGALLIVVLYWWVGVDGGRISTAAQYLWIAVLPIYAVPTAFVVAPARWVFPPSGGASTERSADLTNE